MAAYRVQSGGRRVGPFKAPKGSSLIIASSGFTLISVCFYPSSKNQRRALGTFLWAEHTPLERGRRPCKPQPSPALLVSMAFQVVGDSWLERKGVRLKGAARACPVYDAKLDNASLGEGSER